MSWKVKFDYPKVRSRTYKTRDNAIQGAFKVFREHGIEFYQQKGNAIHRHYYQDGKVFFVHTHQVGLIGIDTLLATAEMV